MKITIESTTKIVTLKSHSEGEGIQTRVWQGKTDSGIPVYCLISRVMVPEGRPENEYKEFETELFDKPKAQPDLEASIIPLRFII